jgi:uracil-DNA glycosylase family protein
MKHILLQPEFDDWRKAAREALQAGYRPEQIDFEDAAVERFLSLALEEDEVPKGVALERPHVSRAFLEAARLVGAHRDPQRWNLLYRVLYRLQVEKNLLKIEVDADVSQMVRLEAQVKRDIHKMEAFVRFRKVMEADDPGERPVVLDEEMLPATIHEEAHHLVLATATPFGTVKTELEPCETADVVGAEEDCAHYIAWYQPDHRVLQLVTPFFAERFAILRWTIMTPDATAAWDPVTKKVTWGPGLPREAAPAEDGLEGLWRSYYASIFNPARLNTEAMRSEMPVRYWKNLPELTILPQLIQRADARVAGMVKVQQEKPSALPFLPEERGVAAIRAALSGCRGCELYRHATQVVAGVGSETASLMLVGEQPGDQEDLQGLPFVGPAGKLLRQVMDELGIDPEKVYVTNAVKHFKFVQRGKLRLHANPRMSEITACKPWLEAEIAAVRPKVVVCLGASAAKSLLGGTFALMKERGRVIESAMAGRVVATVHPSAVLRARDAEGHEQLYQCLRDDLAVAYAASRR